MVEEVRRNEAYTGLKQMGEEVRGSEAYTGLKLGWERR
jgi:hypothetical protein